MSRRWSTMLVPGWVLIMGGVWPELGEATLPEGSWQLAQILLVAARVPRAVQAASLLALAFLSGTVRLDEPILRIAMVASVAVPMLGALWTRITAARAAILVTALSLVVAGMNHRGVDWYGDEPVYLLNIVSLARDGDWFLGNNLRDPAVLGIVPKATEGDPTAAWSVRVGFPLLLAPSFAILGKPGVWLMLCAITGLTGAALFRVLLADLPPGSALLWVLAALFLTPFAWFQGRLFPEIPASLLALLAFAMLERIPAPGGRAGGWLALPAMILLKVRYLPLVAAIGAALAIRERSAMNWRWLLAGLALATVAIGGYLADLTFFNGALLVFRYRDYLLDATAWVHPGKWVNSAAGMLFDQEFGLIWQGPVLALAFWGFAKGFRLSAMAMLLFMVSLLFFRGQIWFGGQNPAGRFLMVLVPSLAVVAARGERSVRSVVPLLTALSVARFFWGCARPEWTLSAVNGREGLLARVDAALGLPASRWWTSIILPGDTAFDLLAPLAVLSALAAWSKVSSRPLSAGALGVCALGALGLVRMLPPERVEAEFLPNVVAAHTLPYPRDHFPLIRQDITDETSLLAYGPIVAAVPPLPWEKDESLRVRMLKWDALSIWPYFAPALQASYRASRKVFWDVPAQGRTIPPGDSITLTPPPGARTLSVRAKRAFESWRPDTPARPALHPGGQETIVGARTWSIRHFAVVQDARELTLGVPEWSAPLDVDWLAWDTREMAAVSDRLQPVPELPACLGAGDFEVIAAARIPWPNGWALNNAGALGAVFNGEGPVRVSMRWQGAPSLPALAAWSLTIDGKPVMHEVISDIAWCETTTRIDLDPGRHVVEARFILPSAASRNLGIFAVDRLELVHEGAGP